MKTVDIYKLLLDDMENKRTFNAKYAFECECGNEVWEGDEFVFLGHDRNRLCMDCFRTICEHLEEKSGQ